MISLTTEERKRFVVYLRVEAATNETLAEQIDKLGPMHMIMAKKYRAEATAATIIANKLESTFTETF